MLFPYFVKRHQQSSVSTKASNGYCCIAVNKTFSFLCWSSKTLEPFTQWDENATQFKYFQ